MVGLESGGLDGIRGLGVVDRLLRSRLAGGHVSFQGQHFHMLEATIDAQGKAESTGNEPTPVPEGNTQHQNGSFPSRIVRQSPPLNRSCSRARRMRMPSSGGLAHFGNSAAAPS